MPANEIRSQLFLLRSFNVRLTHSLFWRDRCAQFSNKVVVSRLGKRVDDFDNQKNGLEVDFIVPYKGKSYFWYKRWYTRACRSEQVVYRCANTESLHVR